ncbi:MAG: prepilin peptidase [Planctomyces sp.]|nr:prepilin peptidase [Planctomyces sp.]
MGEAWFVPLWDSTPQPLLAGLLGVAALLASRPLIGRCLAICEAPEPRRAWRPAIATGVLVGVFAWLMLTIDVQRIPEVRPSPVWDRLVIVHHSVLLVLLTAAATSDWRTCYIPDLAPLLGLAIAIPAATLSGDLQICHLWVDWNEEVPGFQGPYLPGWLSAHPHWHGLAWSLAGAACGAALTGTVRGISRWALGMPALGAGDVLLMAMIGAYLGWQPTVLAFLLAPVLAIAVGLPVRVSTGRPYIPYGPFLALAAMVVLFTWRWLWMLEWSYGSPLRPGDRRTTFAVRRLFGDPWALIGIAAAVAVALAGLLAWRRWQASWSVSRES